MSIESPSSFLRVGYEVLVVGTVLAISGHRGSQFLSNTSAQAHKGGGFFCTHTNASGSSDWVLPES